ncbi:MAG: hypothetical protein C0603_11785 [Denitrovibrio sp.]|nr:MAG: hypothetical protein C0603_11785 [Denitrovibrio sp.]
MRNFLIAIMITSLFLVGCATTSQEAAKPAVKPVAKAAVKPAPKTVADRAMENNLPIVNFDYVVKQLDNPNVLFVDARPSRLFAKGHIPGAVNLESMKYEKSYPAFAALNIPKDKELIFGIGKDCPLSFNDAMNLRKVGYTNLKLYIKPAICINDGYLQLEKKEALKLQKKGLMITPTETNLPANKKAPIMIYSQGDVKAALSKTDELRKAGYKKVFYYTESL